MQPIRNGARPPVGRGQECSARRSFPLRREAFLLIWLALWLVGGMPADAQVLPPPANRPPAIKSSAEESPTNGLGSWIWTSQTFDRQSVHFWRAFEIPEHAQVTHARLVMTVDNEYTLYLDGREIGRGAEWRELFDFDVTRLMSPGQHVLAVKAYNSFTFAGMLFGLRVDLAGGQSVVVKSDESWKVVPEGIRGWEQLTKPAKNWPAATIVAPLAGQPWWEAPQAVNLMPTLGPIVVHFWESGWFQVTFLVVFGLGLLGSLRLLTQLAWHRKEQWLLQRERARIARDIHDDLGSRMTRLVLHGEVTQSELPGDSRTRREIEQICEQARGILSTLDEVLWAVNPKRDSLGDFTSYVCGYAQEYLKHSAIQCLFDLAPAVSDVELNLPLKRALLMTLKEALNNAVKHSGASELTVSIKVEGQKLVMAIADNGKGFDPAVLKSGRNGLTNMKQRMEELDGACSVISRPGEGCRTELVVPLKRARNWPARWQRLTSHLTQSNKPQRNEASEIQHPTDD